MMNENEPDTWKCVLKEKCVKKNFLMWNSQMLFSAVLYSYSEFT